VSTDERMLKPREVAEWLGVHVNTVKRMSDRGELQYYRIGTRGDRRYRPADVNAYLSTIMGGPDGRAAGKRA
jgi:excisionase family DNA binding protein